MPKFEKPETMIVDFRGDSVALNFIDQDGSSRSFVLPKQMAIDIAHKVIEWADQTLADGLAQHWQGGKADALGEAVVRQPEPHQELVIPSPPGFKFHAKRRDQ